MEILDKLKFWKKKDEYVERELPEGYEQDEEVNNEIPPWTRETGGVPRLEEYQERAQQGRMQQNPGNVSQEIILAKLDVINAKLDSINQRLANMDQRKEERPTVRW